MRTAFSRMPILPEHIKAVVAGRPVRTDGYVDPLFQISRDRRDAAGEFGVGARVGHHTEPASAEDLHILFVHPDSAIRR